MADKQKLSKGDLVAHREIDGSAGAKTGIVEEIVGEQEVIVVKFPGQEKEGYDRRELVLIHGPKVGPVMLKPRHVIQALKRPEGIMVLIIALLVVVILNLVSQLNGWSPETESYVAIGFVVIFLVSLLASIIVDRRRRSR